MLEVIQQERAFILKENNQTTHLADPDPEWVVQAVLNFYSNTYPILNNAKISAPEFRNDRLEYTFESVIGTKG